MTMHETTETPASDTASTVALPRLMTVAELAAYLRVNPKTVYDWAARGELPCLRLGNRLRFAADDVLRWLGSRKEG